MTLSKQWIVIADAARARVFEPEERNVSRKLTVRGRIRAVTRLQPAWDHKAVAPTLASRDIASDRPGRTFDSAGEGRHAKEPATDPARYEKQRFAREVAEKLDHARRTNRFDELLVVAPPQFLGDLRAAMPKSLTDCVAVEIDKNLSKLKPDDVLRHLKELVESGA